MAQAFSIGIAAYAVMSNHLHVVLEVDVRTAEAWSDIQVVKQWHQVFGGTVLTSPLVFTDITLCSKTSDYLKAKDQP